MYRPIPARAALAAIALPAVMALGACGSSNESSSSATTTSVASATTVPSMATSGMPASSGSSTTASVDPSAVAPTASATGSAPSSTPATPLPTPSGTMKKFSTAKLPQKLGSYTGQVIQDGSATTHGMYTGTTQDKMLMAAMVGGKSIDVFANALTGATVDGHATCGTQQGVAACVIPLDGGYISLTGTDQDSPKAVGVLANELWEKLA